MATDREYEPLESNADIRHDLFKSQEKDERADIRRYRSLGQ